MKFILSKIPMPPTSNRQYWAQAIKGKDGKSFGKICTSNELNAFKKSFASWQLNNIAAIQSAREFIKNVTASGAMLQVDTYACFPTSELWTIKGMPKKMDGTNRIKALHDSLSDALGLDDCRFWKSSVEKIETLKKEPWCFVVFRKWEPRGLGDLNRELL